MNFQSVAFSKAHIFSPFKLNYKDQEISIQDKKIKTIALSILVGVFTAGIGGVIFLYCLSAKFKIDKLNTIKKEEEEKFIKRFVCSFLTPYITGEITRETDLKDRESLMKLIQKEKFKILTKEEIQETALSAFFKKAASGLYINRKKPLASDNITPKSPEFQILRTALDEALPREFPDKKISKKEVKNRASQALNMINEKRDINREVLFKFSS